MKKSTASTWIAVLSVTAAACLLFGISESRINAQYERVMAANYQHAFSELVSGVHDVDTALQKSALVTSPTMAGAVCSELFATAQTAEMALGVLPFSGSEMENTAGFLNRVGDYAFALSQKAYSGESISAEDRRALRQLADISATLNQNLKSIQDDMGSELQTLGQYERTVKAADDAEQGAVPATLADSMSLAEREFPELPSLIYDGPFSEHLTNTSPRLLEGTQQISNEDGRQTAADFIGARVERVYASGELEGDIPCYRYECTVKNANVAICVSKAGGEVLSVVSDRQVPDARIDAQQALDAARAFLKQKGYESMTESYYMISDNVLTANFAYEQQGVVCYSDLIKVGIALDDCTLKTFEATGYVSAHCERQLPAAEVSDEQARATVAEGLTVQASRLALIPNAGRKELLCHELECSDEAGQKYIVYVNATTGNQEKILIVLEDENGTLTI